MVWYHKIEALLTPFALRSRGGLPCLGAQLNEVERESASGKLSGGKRVGRPAQGDRPRLPVVAKYGVSFRISQSHSKIATKEELKIVAAELGIVEAGV